jgi:hypothetical protein
MKNTLWTFGCSFTAEWHPLNNTPPNNYDKYREWRGGELPDVWPKILAKHLKVNLENHGKGASGNQTIFKTFCNKCNFIKEGDTVVIGWTQIARYPMFLSSGNELVDLLPSETYEEVPQSVHEFNLVNRTNPIWIEEIISFMRIINELAESKKFKVYFWTSDGPIFHYITENNSENLRRDNMIATEYNSLFEGVSMTCPSKYLEKLSIFQETDKEVADAHMGYYGHIYQAEFIKNFILKSENL